MKRKLFLALFLTISFGASSAEKSKDLDGTKFGEDWPLTFEKASVSCVNGRYAFVYDKATDDRYPLNGLAISGVKSGKLEGSDIDAVWKDSPYYKGVKIPLDPVMDAATALCE
ncbi:MULTISPECIES: DUF2511 domain-containing protein [unclassified Enterobacter]|uniref:DUF2511 domain-containing protein n=1 Tax=unclassified Enterobacter TaxID=2608935 RepID=UPI0007A094F6|nr:MULTISPECIES: DUF2511 domain-containing protein [unclassified Enterobacter]KYQ75682.1 hypothetical protein AX755_18270 [Enterobacter sp. SENG-6]PPV38219.1 DUF2511 domain-containing protein [Enterobacter sp. RC4]